jgi:hypothetical protein
VFHEGRKGWSCCKKQVDSFDEFLQIVGCQLGFHSDEIKESPPKAGQTELSGNTLGGAKGLL